MAVLYVTEFANLATSPNGLQSVAAQPPLQEQTVAIGSGSLSPALTFHPATGIVRLHTDAVCSIEIGLAPVATSTTARMAANQTEYFGVLKGQGWTVAVITNS